MKKAVEIFRNPAAHNRPAGSMHPIAISIAFYNNNAVLNLTLAALERQTFQNFELIICDDGSKPESVAALKARLETLRIPATHLWHEDLGFRKNRILNWGIHHCQSEYMIFLDQDCLAHPEFAKEHFENRKPQSVLCGRRMDLTPWVSKILTPEKVRSGFIEKNLWWILPTGLYMKDNNGGKGLHLKSSWLQRWLNKKNRGIVGCNFSVYREDLLRINGFDFRYEGAGIGEDTDIEFRLSLLGVEMRPFVNRGVQYHVYHRLLKRISKNENIFSQVQSEKKVVTDFGLSQQVSSKLILSNLDQ